MALRAHTRVSLRIKRSWGKAMATAGGGIFVITFLSRNKRAPLWGVAPIEAAFRISAILIVALLAKRLALLVSIDSLRSLLPLANAPLGHRFHRSPPGSPNRKPPLVGVFLFGKRSFPQLKHDIEVGSSCLYTYTNSIYSRTSK